MSAMKRSVPDNHRSRRGFLRTGAAAAAASSLVACNRLAARPPVSPAMPVALEFWLPGRAGDDLALRPFHDQFVAGTPAAGSVQTRLVEKRAVMAQLTTAIAAGTPPDVARLKEYQLTDLAAVNGLLPLDRLVRQDPTVDLRDFTWQSVAGSRHRQQLVGLPDSHQLVVLFWNKDLLARADLNPDLPPATWDELRRAARQIAALGSSLSFRPWGLQFYEMSTREQTFSWFVEWVWRAGGDVWNQGRTRATLDQDAALQALQFQVDLLHADRTAVPPGTPVSELIANVAQGRVGLWMTTAPQALVYAQTTPQLRFGFGPMPRLRRDAGQLQHNGLSVLAGSRHPDLAYQLVSYRSREDTQRSWSTAGAWIPVRPALWQQPPLRDDWRWRTIGELVSQPGNRPKPTIPNWEEVTKRITPHLLTAWRGDVAPAQALRAATRDANAYLRSRSMGQ